MYKSYLNWSSGKDAAFSLYKIKKGGVFKVEKLITTINSEVDRVSMHGVRKDLLLRQAESIGIPLELIALDGTVSMEEYNSIMAEAVTKLRSEDYSHAIFGDIFLEDLRTYREEQLKKVGISAIFPLWKKNTKHLITEFIELGFKAITVCVNAKVLDKSFCGREINLDFIKSLPANVDPCGEHGEFHTFVYDGPNFKEPVRFEIGEIIEKKYSPSKTEDDCFKNKTESWDTAFWYCDLLPI
ncbi:diphthine--ammonia ligase [Gillisia sp. CAL575]|uniref:Dph6-related ATP pyrophosphatase n=1 Tax=Gillisia sp. CAL575 TaxID=985255 RepID=UPI00039CD346|nr:diphthine--ammonia ligase [Gillisia sp. CAL575]